MVGAPNEGHNGLSKERPMGMEIARSSPEAVSPTRSDPRKHNGRSHDKEFKIAAVQLVTERKYTPKQAALSLGIPMSTLQYWIKVFGQRPQQEAQTLETLRLRVKQLEAENQRLRIEREILKKATAFFASQQP
jgi:transposase